MLRAYYNLSFSTRIFLWMFLGALLGFLIGKPAVVVKPVGDIFLQLLIMAAIPLVFFNLLAGISGLGSSSEFGRFGIKVALYYLFTSIVAITLGLTIMSFLEAGKGMELSEEVSEDFGVMPKLTDFIIDMVPANIFKSLSEGNLIQIVIFAVILGLATLQLPADRKEKFHRFFESGAELMRQLVEFILLASPLGLGALMAATFGEFGEQILGPLLLFIGGVYTAQVFMVVLYMGILWSVTRISPFWFLRATSELYATTIATCSSLASLAVSLDLAENRLRLPKSIFSFTLPIGAQFNKDGTSIMLSAVLIFTAQAAGIELTVPEMIQVVVVGLLLVEGSGGVPGGALVVAMLYAEAFNLPLEIVAIVGGIYRLIDMGNTTVNCMGDMVATCVVSRLETGWKPDTYQEEVV